MVLGESYLIKMILKWKVYRINNQSEATSSLELNRIVLLHMWHSAESRLKWTLKVCGTMKSSKQNMKKNCFISKQSIYFLDNQNVVYVFKLKNKVKKHCPFFISYALFVTDLLPTAKFMRYILHTAAKARVQPQLFNDKEHIYRSWPYQITNQTEVLQNNV